jgi:hypothetical protein
MFKLRYFTKYIQIQRSKFQLFYKFSEWVIVV